MCAVGHYLEEEGIATTLISLVREHSDAMRPPRALWVPFMLGRPFGVPDDAAFQTRVLRAALDLLDAHEAPATADFEEEAPGSVEVDEGAACPVNFSRPVLDADSNEALAASLQDEIEQLRPWHDLSRSRHGRTTVGVSGLTPEDAAAFVVSQLKSAFPQGDEATAHARQVKFVCDDLRAYYEESGAAQPGRLTPAALERWYYLDTIAGKVLHRLRDRCMQSEAPALQHLGKLVLIPRAIALGVRA
ncbi:MAG: hypothetical protein FJY37_16965 [Betaproteobacteria bacterium]|nr:hypothetical protein [Betaproteobacteria bacterium]